MIHEYRIALGLLLAPIAIGVLNAPFVRAQSMVRPAFEVASVKPIDPAAMSRGHEGHQLDRERYVDRTELLQLIVRAYLGGSSCVMTATPPMGNRCPFISGLVPAWVETERFEIQARMPPNSVPNYTYWQARIENTPELNRMLQVLLEDRFQLKVHWEQKELPVYALTVAKNGPKLKKARPGGVKLSDGSEVEAHGFREFGLVPTPGGDRRTLGFLASSMDDAARDFANFLDRPVVDRTGLQGMYDFTIEFENDPDAPTPGIAFNPFNGLTASELSAALRALGLRLESAKAPLQVLVIDRVEKPSKN
jgi:uncharacterized protein (TIGR03435 family)